MPGLGTGPPIRPSEVRCGGCPGLPAASQLGLSGGGLQFTNQSSVAVSWFPRTLCPSLVPRASGAQMPLLNIPGEEAGLESHMDPQSCWDGQWTQ